MNKDTIKKYETSYFIDISRYLNVHKLASLIQYGADAEDENSELSEREEAAREKLINPVKSVNAIQNESLVDSRNMEKPCSLLILKSECRLVSAYYENYFTDISDEDKIYEGLKKQYNGAIAMYVGWIFKRSMVS